MDHTLLVTYRRVYKTRCVASRPPHTRRRRRHVRSSFVQFFLSPSIQSRDIDFYMFFAVTVRSLTEVIEAAGRAAAWVVKVCGVFGKMEKCLDIFIYICLSTFLSAYLFNYLYANLSGYQSVVFNQFLHLSIKQQVCLLLYLYLSK